MRKGIEDPLLLLPGKEGIQFVISMQSKNLVLIKCEMIYSQNI